jgi:hypothetical protein
MPDQLDSNVHTKETPAGIWATRFQKCIFRVLHEHGVKGILEGAEDYEFTDSEGNVVRIVFSTTKK